MNRESNNPRDLFTNPKYYHYIVEYSGNIQEEISKQPNYYVTIINDKYAIVSTVGRVEINVEGPYFSTILYVKLGEAFTLEQISPIEASRANFLQLELPLNLTGRGVNIAIIDTGIDYLNEEFMKSNGETRIECIWDQTIESDVINENIKTPYGTVYMKEEIDNAIKAYREGKSPYEIVPSKDEFGHGTNMAGIIGSSGKNPQMKGVCPDCDFVIVKLVEDFAYEEVFNANIPIFNITSIFSAFEFLYRYSLRNYKPMVIYFPLGSNLGPHKGNGILEQFLEPISRQSGIAIVTATGNEGANGGHTSGTMSKEGEIRTIEFYVSPEQKNIIAEIWVDSPNIMSLDIVSPSGESSGVMSALINVPETYQFLFERTLAKINYYIPEEKTGDELIRIRFFDITEGIWKIRLIGNNILDGKYNAWIPQKGITVGDTRFRSPDPYGTMTNPSSSSYLITAAAYNQNNNNVLSYSGMAFLDDYIGRIDVAVGGVDALTVAPDNKVAVVNGTSVSAAVLAGACGMLFQWGIVDGNDPYMYSETVKTYIARGTTKRSGDIYPNPQWGYGMLNILVMFQNMV